MYLFLIVNYRGSTGLGQDSIDSLPGKDGTQDVGDVHVSYYIYGFYLSQM